MATPTQISNLGSLRDKLLPLAGKSRGMKIEAAEWNALVNVVGGMIAAEKQLEDSLQSELEAEFAPKQHGHVGEIGISALDPELQARLASNRGPGSGAVPPAPIPR